MISEASKLDDWEDAKFPLFIVNEVGEVLSFAILRGSQFPNISVTPLEPHITSQSVFDPAIPEFIVFNVFHPP